MKQTLAWYVRIVHEDWKTELKLRQEDNRLILHIRKKHYDDNRHIIIDYGEVTPANVTKALQGLKNNIEP